MDKVALTKRELEMWQNTQYTLEIRARAGKVAGHSELLETVTKDLERAMMMVAELERILDELTPKGSK